MQKSSVISPGDIFSTPFEKDCICLEVPDEYGNFDAVDSDNVVCQFNIVMIEEVRKAEK